MPFSRPERTASPGWRFPLDSGAWQLLSLVGQCLRLGYTLFLFLSGDGLALGESVAALHHSPTWSEPDMASSG